MNKMIERVAKAIRDKGASCEYCQDPMLPDCCHYDSARAAIEAIREPDKKMILAGTPVVYACFSLEPGEGLDENPAIKTWYAMTDAILKDD